MTDTTGIFRSGTLLLPSEAPEAADVAMAEPWLAPALVVVTVLLCMILLANIFHAIPPVIKSFTRLRGSANHEGSVRSARDRNITALALILPFVLVVHKAGLYEPQFLAFLGEDAHLAVTLGIFVAYLLLRATLYVQLKPRRSTDSYPLSRRAVWNFFILLNLVMLPTYGLMAVLHASQTAVQTVLLMEMAVFYAFAVFRRGQILASNCNALTTFLYLCGLELIPTGLLVASELFL